MSTSQLNTYRNGQRKLSAKTIHRLRKEASAIDELAIQSILSRSLKAALR